MLIAETTLTPRLKRGKFSTFASTISKPQADNISYVLYVIYLEATLREIPCVGGVWNGYCYLMQTNVSVCTTSKTKQYDCFICDDPSKPNKVTEQRSKTSKKANVMPCMINKAI